MVNMVSKKELKHFKIISRLTVSGRSDQFRFQKSRAHQIYFIYDINLVHANDIHLLGHLASQNTEMGKG